MYFNTSPGLGIPFWWNGTDWVDATGQVNVAAVITATGVKAIGKIGTVTVTTV
jgi:hypothetical protein